MADSFDIFDYVHPRLTTLDPYQSVDPPELLAEKAGIHESQIVKLNGNENPYGPSPAVFEALANSDRLHIYPDPQQLRLREAISAYAGVPVEYVIAGNGSDEIIDLLFRTFLDSSKTLILAPPTFGMYSFTAQIIGANVREISRTDGFQINIPELIATTDPKSEIIALASPNNPTGNSVPVADIQRLLDAGLVVILDEAYGEFGGESATPLSNKYDNLIILRTFSKWAGLAGLRVGYGIMCPQLINLLMRIKPPYSVSQAAEAAVLASLGDLPYISERVHWLVNEKTRMTDLLDAFLQLKPHKSDANFVLCEVREFNAQMLYEGLAGLGVFVRYFTGSSLRNYIRISVGTPDETDRLIDALGHLLNA